VARRLAQHVGHVVDRFRQYGGTEGQVRAAHGEVGREFRNVAVEIVLQLQVRSEIARHLRQGLVGLGAERHEPILAVRMALAA